MGAPRGNRNAETHSAYSDPLAPDANLDKRINDLSRRIDRLNNLIDDLEQQARDDPGSIELESYAKLVGLYGSLCSRLSRLIRDRHHITGDEDSELDRAMDEAIDLAAEMLGTEL